MADPEEVEKTFRLWAPHDFSREASREDARALGLKQVDLPDLQLLERARPLTRSVPPGVFDEVFAAPFLAANLGDHLHLGFVWSLEERTEKWGPDDTKPRALQWRPQGITGTADAYDGGTLDNRKFLLITAHNEKAAGKAGNPPQDVTSAGSRVTVVDVTDVAAVSATESGYLPYAHILLVDVVHQWDGDESHPTFTELHSHVGGAAWIENLLYVASGEELLVFRLDDIRLIPARAEEGWDAQRADILHPAGWSAGRYHARGFRYIWPLWFRYTSDPDNPGGPGIFSTLSIDRSAPRGPRLVSARYIWAKEDAERSEESRDRDNSYVCC